MGTWGIHSFDNSDAVRFLAQLDAMKYDPPIFNSERVENAVGAVLDADPSGLDLKDAAIAVAAAEVMAAAFGHPRAGCETDPYEVSTCLKFRHNCISEALTVLRRVRQEASQQAALWDGTDQAREWQENLIDLERRLIAGAADFRLVVEVNHADHDQASKPAFKKVDIDKLRGEKQITPQDIKTKGFDRMGTWGIHSFDNDTALDFLDELKEERKIQPVLAADFLGKALDRAFDGYIESFDGEIIIAAAEVIAAGLGQPHDGGEKDPYDLKSAIIVNDDTLAIGKVIAAVDRVMADESDLVELWEDSEEADDWRESVAGLRARILTAAEEHGLTLEFTPPSPDDLPDLAERLENKQISADILEEYKAELERLADQKKGDPSVEVLRQLGRKIFRMHNDITNLHYAITQSIDELAMRIDRLEGKDK